MAAKVSETPTPTWIPLFWIAGLAIATLCTVASAHAAEPQNQSQGIMSLISPQGISALASLLSAILWPSITLAALLMFRPELVKFLSRIRKGKLAGVEVELESILKESAEEAASKKQDGPTANEIARSKKVDELGLDANNPELHQQLARLASEYEQVRASMSAGSDRTRKMSSVVAKMRTVGRLAFRSRYKLAASASPGERLLAICSLQIEPDFEMIEWLTERVKLEKPFVGYQAIWALVEATNGVGAKQYEQGFKEALKILSEVDFKDDPGRIGALKELKSAIDRLATRTA